MTDSGGGARRVSPQAGTERRDIEGVVAVRLPAPRPQEGAERSGAMNDAIVYVVDDGESVCRALARLIRSVGITAETFRSAKAFLDYPPVDRPACLVLDIRLPGPSGLDVQEALSQAGRDLPIIFITGHGTVPTTVRAMKGGALDFLPKPFNDQELLDCVQRALRSEERRVGKEVSQ